MISTRYMKGILAGLALMVVGTPVFADDLLMVRSPHNFPEAMLALQDTIAGHGYTLSRVQRVDLGLTGSGFVTDKYRVVFFGKIDEIHALTARYPQLIPYLPLHMTIFAEAEDTLVVMEDPARLAQVVNDPQAVSQFRRWHNDAMSMLDELRQE